MPTDLYTIYYNGHFTQMVYPEQLQDTLAKWGLPTESIEVVQYPPGSVVAPFNVGADKELYILKEEVAIPPLSNGGEPLATSFKSSLNEILSTSEGKKFAKLIKANNEKLLAAGFDVVVVEPLESEVIEPVIYSITATITPIATSGGAP